MDHAGGLQTCKGILAYLMAWNKLAWTCIMAQRLPHGVLLARLRAQEISIPFFVQILLAEFIPDKTVWPSGLRRWLKAPVRKGVGSNPTAVTWKSHARLLDQTQYDVPHREMQIWQHPKIFPGGPTEILTGPCAT